MRGFVVLVALALAHVARSEVFVSDFAALQNAIADGAVIRITSSFDWTGELVIGSGGAARVQNTDAQISRRSPPSLYIGNGGSVLLAPPGPRSYSPPSMSRKSPQARRAEQISTRRLRASAARSARARARVTGSRARCTPDT